MIAFHPVLAPERRRKDVDEPETSAVHFLVDAALLHDNAREPIDGVAGKTDQLMKLLGVEKRVADGTVRLSGYFQRPGNPEQLEAFFEYPEEFASLVAENADPFVPALLLPAMAERDTLEILPPVSRRLWNNLPLIQHIFGAWYPEALAPVPVHTRHFREAAPVAKDCTGAFFSLGVDSFDTLLRHEGHAAGRHKITHLIYMTGFESSLRQGTDGRELPVIEGVQEAARHWGKKAICGRTNLRDCSSLRWGGYYHGAGLAATALSLALGLDRVLVPAGPAWQFFVINPSNPITDPLWSSDDMEIIYDGAEYVRAQKIANTISKCPEAARRLRVCLVTEGGAGNCGFCNKCIRTMIGLEIMGVLRTCGAFPPDLPRDFWRRLQVTSAGELTMVEGNLCLARERGAPRWLIRGLERAAAFGQLEIIRRRRGDLRFMKDLLQLASERTYGRVRLHFYRKQERAFRARNRSVLQVR